MKIEVFALCDAATESEGKLNILGAFDSIFVKEIPTVYPACAIAIRVRFNKVEEGEHRFRLLLVDEDGKNVGPKIEGNVNVKIGSDVTSTTANLIINFQGLKFEKYGEYQLDLAVDGRQEGSLPLNIRIPPNQPNIREN